MENKMTQSQMKKIFKKTFNGNSNFITPKVEKYIDTGDYIVEISSGDRIFSNGTMYGVTVLKKDGEQTELSEGGFEYDEAIEYINNL